jgi:hypothetical protein
VPRIDRIVFNCVLSGSLARISDEVERLRQELEMRKKPKTTNQDKPDDDKKTKGGSDNSSERQRRQRDKKKRSASDRHSFKDIKIHEKIECRVDPATLPPDAVRVEDQSMIVQDIEIKPRNIRFQRHVYYSAGQKKLLFADRCPTAKTWETSVRTCGL